MPTLAVQNRSPLTSVIRFRVPDSLREILEKRAKRIKVSLSEYARHAFLIATGAYDEEIDRATKLKSREKLSQNLIRKTISDFRASRRSV